MKLSFYRSVCDKPGKGDVMSMCVRGINFVSSYDFSARFWNCFDSVVFFAFHFIKILYYDYSSFNKIVSKVTFDDIYLQNPT
jgi:hypothetical protein